MSSFLIKTASPPNPAPLNWVQTEAPDVYLYAGPALNLPGATIIGEWLEDGTPIGPLDTTEYLAIRPLGNDAGQATETLRYHHWLGEAPRRIGDTLSNDPMEMLYPLDNLPFEIDIRHHYFDTPATPSSTGWGFRAEIVGGAASRDPSIRSTGAYTDGTYTTWIWPQVGAFILGPSAWQVDDQGQPLTVWYQDSWDGYRRPAKETYYVALLYGPTMEGKATLPVDHERVVYQFWEHDQGYVPPPAASWVDTGATVAQLVAAGIYRLNAIVTGLAIGQPVRLGELPAGETVFTGYWPTAATPSDYIAIAPHVTAAVGAKVYKWA